MCQYSAHASQSNSIVNLFCILLVCIKGCNNDFKSILNIDYNAFFEKNNLLDSVVIFSLKHLVNFNLFLLQYDNKQCLAYELCNKKYI